MLNGVPENAVKYELTCQPDRIWLTAPPLLANFRPGPNGSSYVAEMSTLCGVLPPWVPLLRCQYSGIRMPPAHQSVAFAYVYAEVIAKPLFRRRLMLTCSESYLTLPSGRTMLIPAVVRNPPARPG